MSRSSSYPGGKANSIAVFSNPVFEEMSCEHVDPAMLDQLLSAGWRHFGSRFFRTSHSIHQSCLCGVMALRLDATAFIPTRSQRRVMRKNSDAVVRILPAVHCPAYDAMFLNHRSRFHDQIPDSLRNFLSDTPAETPCHTMAIEVHVHGRLAAVSFLALGATSTSAIFGMFDPEFSTRSLGVFTMLQEIAFTHASGRSLYYLGYAFTMSSPYDYKMHFRGLEVFDWDTAWFSMTEPVRWHYPWPPDGVESNQANTESAADTPDCQTDSTRDSQIESPVRKHPAGT